MFEGPTGAETGLTTGGEGFTAVGCSTSIRPIVLSTQSKEILLTDPGHSSPAASYEDALGL